MGNFPPSLFTIREEKKNKLNEMKNQRLDLKIEAPTSGSEGFLYQQVLYGSNQKNWLRLLVVSLKDENTFSGGHFGI